MSISKALLITIFTCFGWFSSFFICYKAVVFSVFFTSRLPKNYKLKSQWIKAVREANNNNYDGSGLVCSNHFLSEKIRGSGSRAQLINGSVPSIFLVECIEQLDEEKNECDKCINSKTEMDELRTNVTKLTLDSQIEKAKMQDKIEKLEYISNEKSKDISKLKKQLRVIEQQKSKIDALEQELFTLKTAPNINVILSIQFHYIFQYYFILFFIKRITKRRRSFIACSSV